MMRSDSGLPKMAIPLISICSTVSTHSLTVFIGLLLFGACIPTGSNVQQVSSPLPCKARGLKTTVDTNLLFY